MAPKKNDGKTPASTKKMQEKKVKEKQTKPKPKTPSIIKVKIPIAGANKILSPKSGRISKPTKKKLALENKIQMKLDLANEVAAAQLRKPNAINIEAYLDENEQPKVPKKRGRKKKVDVASSADSDDDFESSPVKKKTRKTPAKAPKLKPDTVKPTSAKKSLSLSLSPKKTAKVAKNTAVSKQLSRKIALANEQKTRKSKQIADTGKQNIGETPSVNSSLSPSILKHVDIKVTDTSRQYVEACPIVSRKTSLNSELSWTKDISSSSTTTCFTVCSTDFVRIDKKIPVLKLDDIGVKKVDNNTYFSSSTSETSSENNAENNADRESSPELESRSLDLSTSSITPIRSVTSLHGHQNSVQNTDDQVEKTNYTLDKLAAKLKKFDLEIVNWIGYDNEEASNDLKKFQGKIFQVLKEESEVISHCQLLKRVLSDNINIDNVNDNIDINDHVDYTNDIAEPYNVQCDDREQNNISSLTNQRSEDDENNFTSDKVKYKSFEQSCDDDDALSLFAESLTGIDSHNSSAATCNAGEFEEYVPQRVSVDPCKSAKKVVYTPTNIFNVDKQIQDVSRAKAVCEKQNADSTSIHKDTEQERDATRFDRPIPAVSALQHVNANIRIPKLMSYYYKPSYGQRSNVLKGICFFNLLSSCKKLNCTYPHVVPDNNDITAKLVRLSEEMFIQEYMLLREWPELRRKYGMCFVEECRRRDLTRILVEMAKDFFMKAKVNVREDATLKIEVIECALLHLNSVELSLCEDLLMYNLQKATPLCDVFMQAIANTQNFSRFKPVFLKLTKFMLDYDRTFSLDVASQILERLSILPCERPLLEALLEIVKHTDRRILENSMLGHFEKQLSVHQDLHEQLLELKKGGVKQPVLSSLYELCVNPELEPVMTNVLVSEREKRYTSPDTTNLDNMNKTTEEPVLTPTNEFNRAGLFPTKMQRSFSNSNSSMSNGSDEFRPTTPKNKPNYKSWRDMSIFNTIRGRSLATRPPMIGRLVHQHMNYGRSPPNFPRRPGPDYY